MALAIPSGAISSGAAMIGASIGGLVSMIGLKENRTISDVFFNPWWDSTVNGIKTNALGYGVPLYNFSYVKDPLWQFMGASIVDPFTRAFTSIYFDAKWLGGYPK